MPGAPQNTLQGTRELPRALPAAGEAEKVRCRAGASLAPSLQEGGRESQRDRAAPVPVNYTIALLCRTSCKISWRLTHGLGKKKKQKDSSPANEEMQPKQFSPILLGCKALSA